MRIKEINTCEETEVCLAVCLQMVALVGVIFRAQSISPQL